MQPDQPFNRIDKSTVKRAATMKRYEKEIDKLYATAESYPSAEAVKLDFGDLDDMTRALRQLLMRTRGLKDLNVDQDIFAAGADSLQVMGLVAQLEAFL